MGYRLPATILEYASQLLSTAAPTVRPSRSVREGGQPPTVTEVSADGLFDMATSMLETLAQAFTTVAVLGPPDLIPDLTHHLRDAGLDVAGEEPNVVVLEASVAKGLEFDAVLVVEPLGIVMAHKHRLRVLYGCTHPSGTTASSPPLPRVTARTSAADILKLGRSRPIENHDPGLPTRRSDQDQVGRRLTTAAGFAILAVGLATQAGAVDDTTSFCSGVDSLGHINNAPLAVDDEAWTAPGGSVVVDVLANDHGLRRRSAWLSSTYFRPAMELRTSSMMASSINQG